MEPAVWAGFANNYIFWKPIIRQKSAAILYFCEMKILQSNG
jgi:hypothetical protein